jgi:ATP-dependent Clp protease ATP-binding subunit ClpC
VLALGRRSDSDARRLLEDRLEDTNPLVRRAACTALGLLASEESLGPLTQVLEDRLGSVRSAAASALGTLPGARVVGLLEKLLRNERSLFPRRAAAESLIAVAEREPEQRAAVLGILACHVPREEDAELSALATEQLVTLSQGLADDVLLATFRQVPRSGRGSLADAFLLSPVPLTKRICRLAAQLRHRAPDADVLARFGSDLTQRASRGELGRAHCREDQLKAIRDRLTRPGASSLVLVGPSGAGKTAIVHELARELAAESVLVPMVIHESTTDEVLSGTRYLGEWQTRLKELQEAIRSPNRAIWYLPDINRLVDAGTSEHSDESFGTMLAPALERGELVIIGESTQEALRRGLDRFPRIAKLFQKIQVDPPTPAGALEIMGRVTDDLVARYHAEGVALDIPAASVEQARDLADDYLPVQARPGNGVHLLTESVSAAVQELEEDTRNWRNSDDDERQVVVPPRRVLVTLSELTGVPLRLLDDSVPLDLNEVRAFFSERVLGQDEAVETVVDLISRPQGVLFFVGPTGVGKTEMAKALAEFIFGSRESLVRIDLGEFRDGLSTRRLVGDPLAPERAARSGLLTAPVRERPFSVVLLDEVEKAHQNVFDLLLPLMDEGRLVDEQGRVTDFRRTIVVMTSNLGSDLTEDAWIGFANPDASKEVRGRTGKVRRVMDETFRPEFLNRISKTVVFAALSLEVMRRLTRREVRRVLARRGILRRNAIVETDDAVIGILLKEGFSARFGARPLHRRVEQLLLKPLARAILELAPDDDQPVIRLGVRDDRLVSEVVLQPQDDEEPVPTVRRASARIKDPRRGRLISIDDLEERALDLSEDVEAMEVYLEEEGFRARKAELLNETQAVEFWKDRSRARGVLSEIAALERTIETPRRLEAKIQRLDRLFAQARRQPGESRTLHDLLVRIGELAHRIEFTNYTLRCPSPADRGDAYLNLKRIDGGGDFPEDVIRKLCNMYGSYVTKKGLGFRVIYERVGRRGVLREAGLSVEGLCAFGLLRGEAGLHQWIARTAAKKRNKKIAFVRLAVFPPADPLRATEFVRERRPVRDTAGVLLKKHRQHLVLTHKETLVAVDGSIDGRPEAEEDALQFLGARVAETQRERGAEPGVVRRYVLSHQPSVRDLETGVKAHLEPVLDGDLDEFVLRRILGKA